jgi:hypothetical protein
MTILSLAAVALLSVVPQPAFDVQRRAEARRHYSAGLPGLP